MSKGCTANDPIQVHLHSNNSVAAH